MKVQLSSLDIYLLIKELKIFFPAKIQKIYDFEKRGLELNLYSLNERTEKKLILMPPDYFSLSDATLNKHQEHPSSFVMLLRKHLNNATLTEIQQPELERILELIIEKKSEKFLLISEFFSKGNIFLCDSEKKILGLKKWQKWKDRTLGVGREYKYPPLLPNPFEISFLDFKKILQKSSKSLGSTLVRDLNLGKNYSEELCLISKIGKERKSNELTAEEYGKLFKSLQKVLKKFKDTKMEPQLVFKEDKPVATIPFQLGIFQGKDWKKKKFSNFYQVINEYFSSKEKKIIKIKIEEQFQEKIESLMKIKKNQSEVIENLGKKEMDFRETGDFIYQNLLAIEKILRIAREDKTKLIGKEIDGIKVREIKGNSLLIEI